MPLDIVATSLPKARREEALIRSAMALLSKAFAGRKFHLVKLNVGATNFVEEAAKGTPSLLSAWAGKERNGTGAERKDYGAERKGHLLEKGRVVGEGGSRERAEKGTDSKELLAGQGETGRGQSGGPLVHIRAEADGLQLAGMTGQEVTLSSEVEVGNATYASASGRAVEGVIGGGTTFPDPGNAGSFGEGWGAEKTPDGTPENLSETLNGGANALSDSPFGAKNARVSEAYAGSVLHANVGSKREARATREAAEGIKPGVLGNGHEEARAPCFGKPGGLAGPGDGFDDRFVGDWDLEEGCFSDRGKRYTGRGFDLEAEEESDDREDLWEDLQSVRMEKRGLRVDTRSITGALSVQGGGSRGASHALQLTDGVPLGLTHRNEGEPSCPREGAIIGLKPDGWLLGTERNNVEGANERDDGKQSEPVDYLPEDKKAESLEGVEAKGFGKHDMDPFRQVSSLATTNPVARSPHKAERITPATSKQLVHTPSASTPVEASTSESYGALNQNLKGVVVKMGTARERCSVCGEALAAEPAARREHVDFHIAMKLQKEEEKIGRLFKEVSSRTGITKEATSGQVKPSRVVSNGRAPKRNVQTLEALWKRS